MRDPKKTTAKEIMTEDVLTFRDDEPLEEAIDVLEEYGITVAERVPLTPHPNDHNLAYLLTKRDRMGHVLPDLDEGSFEEVAR